jgi:alanine transaminase
MRAATVELPVAKKIFTSSSMNKNVLRAEYAVRGAIVVRADEINRQLQSNPNHKFPFNDIVFCNIGNPQQLGQKPISFFRNVLSLVTSPELIDHQGLQQTWKEDIFTRARTILKGIDSKSTGAYTHSQGLRSIRENVAKFITKRDGIEDQALISPDSIFLTDGASPGVQSGLRALIRDGNDGIMIPIPQYPLYSATIQLHGGQQIGYYLNEEKGWSLEVDELERSYKEATNRGVNVRALVIINPGNPTGQTLSKSNMEAIIDFCERRDVLLLADEVYQENVYSDKPFNSFLKVVDEMGKLETFEMISYHSVSKGFLGECGRRGGYFHLSPAIDKSVQEELYKLVSISLCPNVDGQIMVDLMTNPPKKDDPSYSTYIQERDAILSSLKRRATKLVDTLNSLEGISCQKAEGAMYAFPKITIPTKAVAAAQTKGISPDALYVLELLENAGICVVPGSGFGQRDGTYHFRTTFLPPEGKMDDVSERVKKFHNDFLTRYK